MIFVIRETYYNYIAEKMEILATRIKTGGKLNLLGLNIHSETFFRDLLNLIYSYYLKPANVGTANYEAIDLVDSDNKLVVQVTATATTTKINDTLKKDKIKELAESEYNLKFVFISDHADNLRKKTYNNIHNIKFEPSIDIIDKVSILETILQLEIGPLVDVYDFTKKEFGENPSTSNLNSNLVSIINYLASEDLNEVKHVIELNDYGIEEKIEYNELLDIKESTFDEYKIYYGTLDRIYQEFIRQGTNKTVSVFNKITSFYEKEIISKDLSNIEKFFNIIGRVQDYVINSGYLNNIPEEEIEMCVRIIVVDAFIRCKIFKNPRGYTHVVTE
ncbi:ABC-three component system protein [Virgibacillus pantothenticus]|nr:ABC-three component system protein [Virgibacillus pantothenticus]MBU8643493.1 SMEK domain-containing protein [Virgibacillus pantothenticus]MBU8797260.1 SMEK domain-containing protein [Virgibacillus pantothenticus]